VARAFSSSVSVSVSALYLVDTRYEYLGLNSLQKLEIPDAKDLENQLIPVAIANGTAKPRFVKQ